MTAYSHHDAVMALIDYCRSVKLFEDAYDGMLTEKKTSNEVRNLALDTLAKYSSLLDIGDFLLEVEDSPECFGCAQHWGSAQTIDGLTLCPTCEPKRDEIAARLWDRRQEDLSRVS